MKTAYIMEKKCVAVFAQKADSYYWDRYWQNENLRDLITSCKNNDFIMRPLRKYLPKEKGIILEGGCGRAQNVYCMKCFGYNAIGVDFAEGTVTAVNEAVPELDVRRCDVRHLPFKDGEIAGYWSLGVIEHNWDGYDDILDEMKRIIRPNRGFLFLSFPYMSPLRKVKKYLGLYGTRYTKDDVDDFYQFCLDHRKVVEDLEKAGFVVLEKKPFDGIKGLMDEVNLLRPILQRIHGREIGNRICRKFVYCLDRILEVFCSHCMLVIAETRYDRLSR